MATTKNDRIYVRVNAEIKGDFELVAEHRGLAPSTLLHSYIVKTVHEAKKESPEIFAKTSAAAAEPTKVSETKNKTQVMSLDEAKADDESKKSKGKKGS